MTAAGPSPGSVPKRGGQEAAGAPGELTVPCGGLLRRPFHSSSCARSPSFPVSDDTPKPDMTGGCVDRFGVARGGTITPAVVRRAQMRAALDHLAGDFEAGLTGVIHRSPCPAPA